MKRQACQWLLKRTKTKPPTSAFCCRNTRLDASEHTSSCGHASLFFLLTQAKPFKKKTLHQDVPSLRKVGSGWGKNGRVEFDEYWEFSVDGYMLYPAAHSHLFHVFLKQNSGSYHKINVTWHITWLEQKWDSTWVMQSEQPRTEVTGKTEDGLGKELITMSLEPD